MKKLHSILGNSGAVLAVVLAAASPFLLFGWFQKAIGAAGLRIEPTYSGGELSHVIQRDGYLIRVNRPVLKRSPFQRVDPFVQMTWTPAASLPARVADEVDIDGDGAPDVLAQFHGLEVDVTPLRGGYRVMHSKGVTSFSALIARVKDGIVVRIPLGK